MFRVSVAPRAAFSLAGGVVRVQWWCLYLYRSAGPLEQVRTLRTANIVISPAVRPPFVLSKYSGSIAIDLIQPARIGR